MQSERDYLVKHFKNKFSSEKSKKIVFYGIGINTEILLEEFPDWNVLGLMDGFKTDGTMYGKPIISLEQLTELKPDLVIIVGRPNTVKIIFKRIKNTCMENCISVFDVYGNDLFVEAGEIANKKSPYFHVSEVKLKEAIDSHEVISFDIFDTLLMRKVLYPQDVFILVEREAKKQIDLTFNFYQERIQAERELLLQTNPNLLEIYTRIKETNGISEDEMHLLMELELSIEKKALTPRAKMVEMLAYAVRKNKRVYLISDMYLNKDQVCEILKEQGINGYSEIFMSCEYRTSKCENLFSIFKEKVKGESYLHIGDNPEADVRFAVKVGIEPFQILSAVDILEISSYREVLDNTETFDARMMIGLFAVEAFNNPFILFQSGSRLTVNDYEKIGYLFFAPLISEFMLWKISSVQKDKCDHILFAARDGYLIHQLYQHARDSQKWEGLPTAEYFLTSRYATVAAGIEDEQDFIYASKMAFDGTPEEMLAKRFSINSNDISPYKEGEDNLLEYLFKHKNEIYQKKDELRSNYLKYVEKCNFGKNEKLAFFDFVSSGTSQLGLSAILQNEITGYYFLHLTSDYFKKSSLPIKSWISGGSVFEVNHYLMEVFIFIENVLSSPDPSLHRFDENGNPCFLLEERSDEQLAAFTEIRLGIKKYFEEFIMLYPELKNPIDCKNISELFLRLARSNYTNVQAELLQNTVLKDEFVDRDYQAGSIFD